MCVSFYDFFLQLFEQPGLAGQCSNFHRTNIIESQCVGTACWVCECYVKEKNTHTNLNAWNAFKWLGIANAVQPICSPAVYSIRLLLSNKAVSITHFLFSLLIRPFVRSFFRLGIFFSLDLNETSKLRTKQNV